MFVLCTDGPFLPSQLVPFKGQAKSDRLTSFYFRQHHEKLIICSFCYIQKMAIYNGIFRNPQKVLKFFPVSSTILKRCSLSQQIIHFSEYVYFYFAYLMSSDIHLLQIHILSFCITTFSHVPDQLILYFE